MSRKAIAVLVILVALITTGAIYQYTSEQNDRALIPGELVEIDGHEFHLLCQGEGYPIVVLENGLTSSYPDWLYTMEGISHKTTVCAYDRLGLGWSSVNDKPTRAADVANYLHTLLEAKGLTGPTILVGFSAGGFYVRQYYQRYPQNIVGMMLIDSSHEQQAFRMQYIPNDLSILKFCNAIAWTGIGRLLNLFGGYVESSFSEARHAEQLRAFNRTTMCHGQIQQNRGFKLDQFTEMSVPDFGDLPLVVIAASKTLREDGYGDDFPADFLDEREKVWPELQKELATISTDSVFIEANNSSHAVHLQQPELVISALGQLIEKVRLKIGRQ